MGDKAANPVILDETYNHGIINTYNRGCRCDECRTVKVASMLTARRQRKARLKLYPDLPIVHGRYTTYSNWGCKCDPCCEAQRVYHRMKRARRKQREAAAQ